MKRKLLATVLSLCMVVGLLPATAMAAEGDGNSFAPDTSWYNESETNFTLMDADDLAGLAQLVNGGNSFSGKTIILGAGIDLGGKEWTPIGHSGKAFMGTFDGGGCTISNLVINQPGKSDVGLFGYTSNGEVKNFTLNNAKVTGYLDVGAVAGTPYTTKYTNITVTGLIQVNGFAYVGGALGKNAYANITNVDITGEAGSYVNAESEIYRTYVGGLIGFMGEGSQTVSDCDVKIDVTGSTCDVGGILGILHYGNTLTKCTYEGSLTLTNPDADVGDEFGALVGTVHNGGSASTKIESCVASVTKATSGITDVTETITPHGDFYNNLASGNDNTGTVTIEATINNAPVTVSNDVAKVGNEGYKTFQEAIAAANDGSTLELLTDVKVDTWNQVWNTNNLTIQGNGHTITVGKVESGVNGNYLFYNATNLNVSDLTVTFKTNGNGFDMNSGKLENVTMNGGESSNYAVFVGASEGKVEVDKCTFNKFGTAIYSQPSEGGQVTSDISVTNSEITDCDIAMVSYAADTTFTGNTVTGATEISFAAKADSGNTNANYTITGNTFQGAGKIWFYGADLEDVTFTENQVLGNTVISTEDADAQTTLNVSGNYWGGEEPGQDQISGSNTKSDNYYTEPAIKPENKNDYIAGVTLDKTALTLTVEGSATLTATVEGNKDADKTVTWSSSDAAVATVDGTGKVTAVAVGSAVITATAKGDSTKTASCTVTVSYPYIPVVPTQPTRPSQPDTPDVPDTPVAPAVNYTDVAANDWFHDEVAYVTSKGLMTGTTATAFAPNSDMSRAMVWTVLARMSETKVDGGDPWYSLAQSWAVTSGVSDGTNPNGSITREELAAMLYRYAGSPAVGLSEMAKLGQFNDGEAVSDWAQEAMAWAVSAGIITGNDGAILPQQSATRAEVAAMLMRFCELNNK